MTKIVGSTPKCHGSGTVFQSCLTVRYFFLERDREREQPGGVHLSDAADPPHPDLQVMPKFLVLLSGLRIRFHKIQSRIQRFQQVWIRIP
jgi:hypothetical protein